MRHRIPLLASVLAIGVSALLGVTFSGATWTATTHQPVSIAAAADWTPPTVNVPSVAGAVQGASVTVSASAADDRSAIAALTLQYAPAGTTSWTDLPGCTDQGAGTSAVTRTCTWDTTAVADGDYQLRAVATDAAGYSATSEPAATSVVNNASAVLTPLPAAVAGTVTVRGDLYNAGNNGTNLVLEFRPAGGASWTQLNNSCSSSGTSISCGWITTALADGSYDVQLRSNKTNPDVQYAVVVDNTPPTVTVSVPTGTLSGVVDLGATAADPLGPGATAASGVASVELQLRPTGSTSAWSSCGTDTTAPWSCTLDTAGLGNVSYDFRAVATDGAGTATASSPVTRSVDNTPATVSISNPLEGAVVDGTLDVRADAQSTRGVASVLFEWRPQGAGSWTTCGTDSTAPYSCAWATGSLAGGTYELRATLAQGAGGNVVSAVRTVTVDHSVGTVTITSPAGGSTLTQASVTVSGTAASTHGVTSVTLSATPTNPAGSAVSVPCTVSGGSFSCAWNTSAITWGEYDLRADLLQGNGVTVSTATATHVTVDRVVASVTMALSTPPSSGYVSGTETLTATTSSNYGVSSVRYERSPAGAGTWTAICSGLATSPYSCTLDTTTLATGSSYDLRAVMTLPNGQTRTSAVTTVTAANLRGLDVQGTTLAPNGAVDANDTVTYTWNTRVNPGSIYTGWDGTGTKTVSVTLDGGSGNGTTLTAAMPSGVTGTLNLGQVAYTGQYASKNAKVTFGNATIALASNAAGQSVLTLKLNTPTQNSQKLNTDPANSTITWTPSGSVTGFYTGSALVAATVTESGTADKDF